MRRGSRRSIKLLIFAASIPGLALASSFQRCRAGLL